MLSDSWEDPPASSSSPDPPPKEFKAAVEVYLTTAAAANLRKPPPQRKKSTADRRDSALPATRSNDESQKRLRAQSSWMGLGRGPVVAGQWKGGHCRLWEVGEGGRLQISIDGSGPYQTVYIHALNHTDIRLADASLFLQKDCIAIYCHADQREVHTPTSDPLYIKFDRTETCNFWLALLRSHAVPEIYGRDEAAADGGGYRMWREVNMTILEGRNLGNQKPLTDPSASKETDTTDVVDMDVSCEIQFNDRLCGRTTVQKGIGSPDWHEEFAFTDLPPFGTLNVKVWKEKKTSKPVLLGAVRIALGNFRRGEAVEGWFPVLNNGPIVTSVKVGDLRMRIRVDEEIVLPMSCYSKLMQTISARNCLDWIHAFDEKLKLKTVSRSFVWLMMANNTLLQQLYSVADREVDVTPRSHTVIFRGNSVFTKTMERCMTIFGRAFLEASIGGVLRRLCQEKIAIEVDPKRNNRSQKDVDKNLDLLMHWVREFWAQIRAVRHECPPEMRLLFQHIRKLVATKYQVSDDTEGRNRNLPWQGVSAFCFLRFIAPAILNPHLFGLFSGRPPAPVQRSLTLIAKVIQSLANLNTTVGKEDYMKAVVIPFLQEQLPTMMEYLNDVSTCDPGVAPLSATSGPKDIPNALRWRGRTQPALVAEAVPLLPYLVDLPAQVAAIAAAVACASRGDHHSRTSEHVDEQLDELIARSGEIEASALQRVSQLASRAGDPPPASPTSKRHSASPTITPQFRRSSISKHAPSSHRSRKISRPFTAPSQSDLSDVQGLEAPSDTSLPSSPVSFSPLTNLLTRASQVDLAGGQPSSPEDAARGMRRSDKLQARSTSTDSVPHSARSQADFFSRTADSQNESDDQGRKKKGILKSILRIQ